MSIEKQVIINKLLVPKELISIIKDYCFEDKLVFIIKKIKLEIIKKFKTALSRNNSSMYNFYNYNLETNEYDISYYNPDDYEYNIDNYNDIVDNLDYNGISDYDFDNNSYDPDISEHWAFSFDIYNEKQFQAMNCNKCGNYINNNNNNNILNKIKCNCI
jgi:hypothetical protein